jgi:predicted DNA-binding transcriptional regulator AlpA
MRNYDFPLRQFLTTPLAATYLGFRPATLKRWRHRGRGPRYVKHGYAVRYDQGDLDLWLATHTREPARPRASPTGSTGPPIGAAANLVLLANARLERSNP